MHRRALGPVRTVHMRLGLRAVHIRHGEVVVVLVVRRRGGEPRVVLAVAGAGVTGGDGRVGRDVHAVVLAEAHEDVVEHDLQRVLREAGGHLWRLEEERVGGVVRDLGAYVSEWR